LPLALTDHQLQLLLSASEPRDPDKRSLLLERIGARLRCNGTVQPTDRDVEGALAASLRGLRHDAA
jgi:hypothetical protein